MHFIYFTCSNLLICNIPPPCPQIMVFHWWWWWKHFLILMVDSDCETNNSVNVQISVSRHLLVSMTRCRFYQSESSLKCYIIINRTKWTSFSSLRCRMLGRVVSDFKLKEIDWMVRWVTGLGNCRIVLFRNRLL